MIEIPYTRTDGVLTFSDTLFIDEDVYATMTSEEVMAMQDARFASWLDHVRKAPSEIQQDVINGE